MRRGAHHRGADGRSKLCKSEVHKGEKRAAGRREIEREKKIGTLFGLCARSLPLLKTSIFRSHRASVDQRGHRAPPQTRPFASHFGRGRARISSHLRCSALILVRRSRCCSGIAPQHPPVANAVRLRLVLGAASSTTTLSSPRPGASSTSSTARSPTSTPASPPSSLRLQ